MKQFNVENEEFVTFENSVHEIVRGTILFLDKNRLVLEIYDQYAITRISEIVTKVKIIKLGKIFNIEKAVVANLVNTGLVTIVTINLSQKLYDSKFRDLTNLNQSYCDFTQKWLENDKSIDQDYRIITSRIKSFLGDLNRWVRRYEINRSEVLEDALYDRRFIDKISMNFIQNIFELFSEFEYIAGRIDDNIINIHKRFSQRELHTYILTSPFVNRAYTKPLGYAGDYEMVDMMFRDPFEGAGIYSKLVNYAFLSTGPIKAHRNRVDILYKEIMRFAERACQNNQKAKILNFACGPAIEIRRFMECEEISDFCEFTIMDFSKDTLNYTGKKLQDIKLKYGRKTNISIIHKSAHEVIKESLRVTTVKKEYDFIYCAGIFDYLTDRTCSRLLNLFFNQIVKDGKVLATNVDPSNPVRYIAEHLMEWYVLYRNKDHFANLFCGDGKKKVYNDKTGYNLFLDIRK